MSLLTKEQSEALDSEVGTGDTAGATAFAIVAKRTGGSLKDAIDIALQFPPATEAELDAIRAVFADDSVTHDHPLGAIFHPYTDSEENN